MATDHLGAILGHLGALSGRLVGFCWAVIRPSKSNTKTRLRTSQCFEDFRSELAILEAILDRVGRPLGDQLEASFVHLGAILVRLVGLCSVVLEPSTSDAKTRSIGAPF